MSLHSFVRRLTWSSLQFMSENYTNHKYFLELITILQISAGERNLCKLCIFADDPLKKLIIRIIVQNYGQKIVQIFDIKHKKISLRYNHNLAHFSRHKEFMLAMHHC